MTQRERLLAVIRGERPDRVPWVADITYWRSARERDGTLPEEYAGAEGNLRQHRDLGLCAYFNYDTSMRREAFDGVDVETEDDDRVRRTTWRASEGTLSLVETYAPTSSSWAITDYPVKGEEDLHVLRAIMERKRVTSNARAYRNVDQSWGQAGFPCVLAPRSPLPALMVEWAGVANLAYLAADAPEEVEATLAAIEEAEHASFEIFVREEPPLVHFADNLSCENVAGYFDRWMRPYYLRRLNELHAADIRAAVHLDGTIGGLLRMLSDTGFDAVESLTPHPVGDADVADLRALAGREDLILWGGVPGAIFAPPFTRDDMRAHVERVLAICGRGPFILGSADQIPPNGDIALCEMIAEIVERFVP